MEFNYFLTSFLPSHEYGGKRLYDEMVEQAKAADRLGFVAVSIPEHHLVNVLIVPSPLQMAVRVAAETRHVEIVTSVVVLQTSSGVSDSVDSCHLVPKRCIFPRINAASELEYSV